MQHPDWLLVQQLARFHSCVLFCYVNMPRLFHFITDAYLGYYQCQTLTNNAAHKYSQVYALIQSALISLEYMSTKLGHWLCLYSTNYK